MSEKGNGQEGPVASPVAEPVPPPAAAAPPAEQGRERQRMRVDRTELKSSYCNVCNGSATREEVVLNFGVNLDWDRGEREYDVKLLHRIVLSPYAAKRVATLLDSLVKDHERRHGELK